MLVQEGGSPSARAEELQQSLQEELDDAKQQAAAAAADRRAAEQASADLQAQAQEVARQQDVFKVQSSRSSHAAVLPCDWLCWLHAGRGAGQSIPLGVDVNGCHASILRYAWCKSCRLRQACSEQLEQHDLLILTTLKIVHSSSLQSILVSCVIIKLSSSPTRPGEFFRALPDDYLTNALYLWADSKVCFAAWLNSAWLCHVDTVLLRSSCLGCRHACEMHALLCLLGVNACLGCTRHCPPSGMCGCQVRPLHSFWSPFLSETHMPLASSTQPTGYSHTYSHTYSVIHHTVSYIQSYIQSCD